MEILAPPASITVQDWAATPVAVQQVLLATLTLVTLQQQQVVELQSRVAELEARFNQHSQNSSKPPSSDPPSAHCLIERRTHMGIVVNPFWLDRLWDPISGDTNENDYPLEDLNTEDKTEVQRFTRAYLAPGLARLAPNQQLCLKETFRYSLNAVSDKQLESAIKRCTPPFRMPRYVRLHMPSNIRWFYEVIWQSLFGPEDWHTQDLDAYIVDHRFGSPFPFPSSQIVVNPYWLDRLWSPVSGGADVNDHPLEELDAEDETEVRRLVREYLAPGFARFRHTEQFRLKETFRYGLNAFSDLQLERAFDAYLPPFSPPPNIRWFYEVIWNELFGLEDWHIQALDQYIVVDDFSFTKSYQLFWED